MKIGFIGNGWRAEGYFNYFRSRHLNVPGTHGEQCDYGVTYWDGRMPVSARMERQDMGKDSNPEGYFHRGITRNGEFICENPFAEFAQARLTDDEIAMGTLLLGMERMIAGGDEIYPLKEALEDTYLYLMMDKAIYTGTTVRTTPQIWNC